ncbi:hypothetical protein NDN08_003298 [Rhodosorus marinus]|uniref:Peroxisomal membrane protein MPV17 n=1 Tax=Rhodosorus marinus TaxID=101924 RepID=A0AAV8UZS4_9RHOD|nr:hypothetical protein NDN08_003298 [Rhodosorus marinus]
MENAFVVTNGLGVKVARHGSVTMKLGGGKGGGRPWKIGGVGRRSSFGSGKGGSGMNAGGGSDGLSGKGGNRSGGGSGDAGAGSNPLVALWTAYNSLLESQPILTKALTSLVGFAVGDALAQKYLGDGEFKIDRLLRMAAFGALFHGPTGHYFYGFLDRLIVGTEPLKVVSKVAIDQLLWAPIFGVAFFGILGAMEGKSVKEIKAKIENDLVTAVTTSWKVWPLAHAINFRFIPTEQRLLYINAIQIGYNVFLSIIGNAKVPEKAAA